MVRSVVQHVRKDLPDRSGILLAREVAVRDRLFQRAFVQSFEPVLEPRAQVPPGDQERVPRGIEAALRKAFSARTVEPVEPDGFRGKDVDELVSNGTNAVSEIFQEIIFGDAIEGDEHLILRPEVVGEKRSQQWKHGLETRVLARVGNTVLFGPPSAAPT